MQKHIEQSKLKSYFLVPDMPRFVREVTEYGATKAMLRRLLTLKVSKLVQLGWKNKMRALDIARKDFTAGMLLLLQMDITNRSVKKNEIVILADQTVDMAVAMKNSKLLVAAIQAIRDSGARPAIMTNNLPKLVEFLSSTKVHNVLFFFPCSITGYEMNPNQKSVENCIKMLEPESLYAITNSDKQNLTYVAKLGITHAVAA